MVAVEAVAHMAAVHKVAAGAAARMVAVEEAGRMVVVHMAVAGAAARKVVVHMAAAGAAVHRVAAEEAGLVETVTSLLLSKCVWDKMQLFQGFELLAPLFSQIIIIIRHNIKTVSNILFQLYFYYIPDYLYFHHNTSF
jgi:hypothetical protein